MISDNRGEDETNDTLLGMTACIDLLYPFVLISAVLMLLDISINDGVSEDFK